MSNHKLVLILNHLKVLIFGDPRMLEDHETALFMVIFHDQMILMINCVFISVSLKTTVRASGKTFKVSFKKKNKKL